jgi:hypothetical protein
MSSVGQRPHPHHHHQLQQTPSQPSQTSKTQKRKNVNETLLSAVKRHDIELVKKSLFFDNANSNYLPPLATGGGGGRGGGGGGGRNWSPLQEAVANNYLDIVELLLSVDADVNISDNKGNTPLHLSCVYDRYQITSVLIENECALSVVNRGGQTPLHLAASAGETNLRVVFIILEPQFSTFNVGSTKCARILLMCGLSPNTQCRQGLFVFFASLPR